MWLGCCSYFFSYNLLFPLFSILKSRRDGCLAVKEKYICASISETLETQRNSWLTRYGMVAGFHYGYGLMLLWESSGPKHQSEVVGLSALFFSPTRQG